MSVRGRNEMELVLVFGLLLALAVASVLWGADSRTAIDSREWAQRKEL